MNLIAIISFAFLFLFGCKSENEITVGTFNIAWLGDGVDDRIPRIESDYNNIKSVINSLEPDVLALQEIENEEAIHRIIDTNIYNSVISSFPKFQKTALVINKKIDIIKSIELDEIALGNKDLRPGIIAYCKYQNFDFLVGSFHFKSTSRYDDTPLKKLKSFEIRKKQSTILLKKMKEISIKFKENDIVLLGDFNDNPTKSKSNIERLENDDFDFVTSDLNSCKFSIWKSIDHIILSKNLTDNLKANSIYMQDINAMFSETQAEKISDHCPVIARLILN